MRPRPLISPTFPKPRPTPPHSPQSTPPHPTPLYPTPPHSTSPHPHPTPPHSTPPHPHPTPQKTASQRYSWVVDTPLASLDLDSLSATPDWYRSRIMYALRRSPVTLPSLFGIKVLQSTIWYYISRSKSIALYYSVIYLEL